MERIEGDLVTPTPIPEEILLQILQELPAKSLMRFRCVSKHWCSMIEDQEIVDAFRVGSHKRGPKLLVRKSCSQDIIIDGRRKEYDFFLVDLQAKSVVPIDVPVILQTNQLILRQPVEGLVCCNKIIWNPTTRKTITLTQRNRSSDLKKVIENMVTQAGNHSWSISSDYFLGFDLSIKKYKVLSITRLRMALSFASIGRNLFKKFENLIYAEVLTLGSNNFWKNTKHSLPQELCKFDNFVVDYCSINGIIYMIITLRMNSGPEYRILAFDLSREDFQLLPLPGAGSIHFAGELGGRFALIRSGEEEKIWILEECLQGGKWIVVDTPWPECWKSNPERNGCPRRVRPFGSNQAGEILFQVWENSPSKNSQESSHTTIYVYNMESKDARIIPELTGFMRFQDDIFPKFVESIQPLM